MFAPASTTTESLLLAVCLSSIYVLVSSLYRDVSTVKPQRPQSVGLPPSEILNEKKKRDKHRNRYPAKQGRISMAKTEEIVAKVMETKGDMSKAEEIAIEVSQDVGTIRATIRKARATLQSRAEEYVDIHTRGAVIAASLGNTKPAEWALERIAEGKDRIVDPPAAQAALPPPTLNVGIMLGGMPTPKALPVAVDGETT
jgi:hypothetical protein